MKHIHLAAAGALGVLALIAVPACSSTVNGGSGGAGGMTTTKLAWFKTCGDPVCGMPTDDPAVADCTTEKEGDACSTDGVTCEIAGDTCNVNLLCAAHDPRDAGGGCPISRASAKRDIRYLNDLDREQIRADVMSMPLATYRYTAEGGGEKVHLGFIIDDQPPSSPAVRPSGERVDLYGYTSMAIAAIQAEDRQIQALREEVLALRAELQRARGAGAAR